MQKIPSWLLPDAIAVLGLASLGYGLYSRMPWLSFVVVGALLLVAGAMMGRNQ